MNGKRADATPARPLPEPAEPGVPDVVAIVGPTASGKTELGIALATALGGEVLSADSQQVYRGLDVGTAKATAEEQARVKHHLLDLVEPDVQLTAADWAERADEVIASLSEAGMLPIVVGGTGLWIRALLMGLVDAPPGDEALRARLEAEAHEKGREALHRRLAEIDPETAAATPSQNLVRVIRALEIHALTGEPPSVLRARHGFGRLRYRARVFGISPPREELYRRIDTRAAKMFVSGLLEETRSLLARGLRDAPGLKALGYREAAAVIDGELSVDEAIARTAQGSRRYAKRQLTWFRNDPLVEWLPWPVDVPKLVDEIRRWRGG